jgi:hypothetical protein
LGLEDGQSVVTGSPKWNAAREEFVGNDPDGIDIRPLVDAAVAARACSGDMYSGVPRTPSSEVKLSWLRSQALTNPKSDSLQLPARVTSTFAGLTSRCTIPRPDAYPSAAVISRNT